MAVKLSSDLIADVMRNADPARFNAAAARLQDLRAPEGASADFANLIDGMNADPAAMGMPWASAAHKMSRSEAPGPYVEFERMVLRNLFETLLPKADSGTFGTGPSAGVWRSLAADQLAGVYADTGGIGIASTLASEEGGGITSQWPYFSARKIEAFTG